jgi:hypothetical protein
MSRVYRGRRGRQGLPFIKLFISLVKVQGRGQSWGFLLPCGRKLGLTWVFSSYCQDVRGGSNSNGYGCLKAAFVLLKPLHFAG